MIDFQETSSKFYDEITTSGGDYHAELDYNCAIPGSVCLHGFVLLVIGLRGIVFKKPFLISARWLFILVLLGFSPGLFQFLWFPKFSGGPGMLLALGWLIPVMFIVILIFLYLTLRGYTAFGVTDKSFREGLLYSLRKLNLPHEETLAALRLPTIGADLQVSAQSWMGTGQVKMKQRQFGTVLRDIVNGMNEYYQSGAIIRGELDLLHILRSHRRILGGACRDFLVRFRQDLLRMLPASRSGKWL